MAGVSGGLLAGLYSAVGQNPALLLSQGIRIAVALGAMLVMAQIEPVFLRRAAPWIYGLATILLMLVIVTGDVETDAATFAVKYHGFSGENEYDVRGTLGRSSKMGQQEAQPHKKQAPS